MIAKTNWTAQGIGGKIEASLNGNAMSKYKHFTEEQISELEVVFGLNRQDETLPVRDGSVKKGDMVWWRSENGPEYVDTRESNHWQNIADYPDVYQISKPVTSVIYKD